MKPPPKLKKFGEIKTCKFIKPDILLIVLTKGFKNTADNTFNFLETCICSFPEHEKVETCITEENFAMLILKKVTN